MGRGMNHEQSKIAFMTGFGISFPSARKIDELKDIKVKPADVEMEPKGAAPNIWGNSSKPSPSEKKTFDIASAEKLLRDKKILPDGNITDSANGVFQTDTGEITMDLAKGMVVVSTPKTEAAALKPETKNIKVGRLTVNSTSVPASVAVISIDDKPLAESGRMVLVYNTDNSATDCELTPSREVLVNVGKPPIIVRTGKLSAEFKLPEQGFWSRLFSPKEYAVYALKLNGKRSEKIPFEVENGVLKINLDTASLSEPALFYEITAE